MNGVITTKEAAARLNVSVRRVQALIAAGRLPAEKIGNTFAIKESDLKAVNGRKNGRPQNGNHLEEKDWDAILNNYTSSASLQDEHHARPTERRNKKQKRKKVYINKKILDKPPHKRTQEEWNTILDKILGRVSLGPRDLSTNKKYMEGFGRENAYRR